MAFDKADRDRAIETHTLVKTYEKRLDKLEAEDKVLHGRVTRTQISLAGMGTIFTGISGWLKMKLGG